MSRVVSLSNELSRCDVVLLGYIIIVSLEMEYFFSKCGMMAQISCEAAIFLNKCQESNCRNGRKEFSSFSWERAEEKHSIMSQTGRIKIL